MAQFHRDPDGYLDLMRAELPGDERLQRETAAATGQGASRILELGSGGRFVLGDVIVPEGPADALTPVDDEHDRPSSLADQLRWLQAAGFRSRVAWAARDLVVVAGAMPAAADRIPRR